MSMPGFWELIALAVLALLIFGPDRLPGVIRNVGRTVGTVRREARVAIDELKSSGDLDELRGAARDLRGEADTLRREGRDAGRELRRTVDDGADADIDGAATPVRDGALGEPAPFDPDTP